MKLSEYKNVEQPNSNNLTNDNFSQTAKDLFDTYKNMDQSELMKTIMDEVAQQKQKGTFDYEKLNASLSQVLPFLSDEQKNNLLTILQKLK